MDKKHLNTLEFPKILAHLARHTTFSASHELALRLEPSPVFSEVQHRLQETREARYLLDSVGGISLGGAHDIRPLARHALRGATLPPTDLLYILDTLRAAQRVRRILARQHDRIPLLADIASRIEPCEGLAGEINRCISDQGEVVDHASDKLATVRRELRTAHERLLDKLNRMITSARLAPYLQEALITQRSGRYVIPIKADFKGRVSGIVHDSSSSGATLFIEPLSAVEMGNQWRQLQLEEEKEIERILSALSAQVGGLVDELGWTVDALAELDLALAKGRYAGQIEATEPLLVPFRTKPAGRHPGSTLDLRQARHPLLDPQKVVPIDVHLGDDYYVLVITGPNTGGKTVSLKTIGLMAAMTQSGLHLPAAEGSSLSVFDGIFADIGDEQSIEQSLSTFSAHLTNIIHILGEAGEHSLLLLDELGAGTDPVEGSALARAVLSHVLEKRFTTLVATHYSELKGFAQTTPGVENASVEFDVETLSPTFKLQVGLPGRSNAFAIAERLGLPPSIVREARALVSPEELETESLLAEIQQAHREALAARDEAARAQRTAREQQDRVSARLATIEAEKASILGEARAEARRELASIREELGALRSEATGRKQAATLTDEWLAEARKRVSAREDAVSVPVARPTVAQEDPPPGELAIGDVVWVAGLQTTGKLVSLEGDSAQVQVGSFFVRARLGEIEWRGRPQAQEAESRPALTALHPSPGLELDLRGQTAEEIRPRLDKYLDDAFLAALPFVRIVHGKGGGVLRQAVREMLRAHPLVRSFREGAANEGGTGVTVAYLQEGS
ncbi:MAG TPA: endonuclease MutS2 [Anaerolineae bacterium]|nr:endonuclease MutS2 [Anaerolineae bacterium]